MAHTRCNRYTVPASVNFDMNRLWIRVNGLPLGFLDPKWAVKTLDLVGLVETLEYDEDGLPDEPEFRGQKGEDNEPDNSDSNSLGAGDHVLPNGHVIEAAPTGDNNDNIEPEFIPISGVYQNGYMSHPNNVAASTTSHSSDYNSASEQRKGDPYAPFTEVRTQFISGGGFRISAALEESFLTDRSDSEEFILPPVISSAAADFTPALLENLFLEDKSDAQLPANAQPAVSMRQIHNKIDTRPQKRSSRGPFHRCRSYDQDPFLVIIVRHGLKNVAKLGLLMCKEHLGFLARSPAQCGGNSTGCPSNRFMGLSGGKRKVEEAGSASSRKLLKFSADGFAFKAFRNGTGAFSGHLSSAFLGQPWADTLLQQGCNWKISNVCSTLAGSTKWVNGSILEFKPRILLRAPGNYTISHFIHPQTNGWDTDKLSDWFVHTDALIILAMELPDTTQEDFRYWSSTPSGRYSVKTGYAMLHQQPLGALVASSVGSFRKILWSLQLQPKWKLIIFMEIALSCSHSQGGASS
uniref:DUF4283 domain-containing protein n=1 Tax=Chenopodium quinoa TaxID=63459 RepID=A0A803MX91_CHEQI